MFDYHYKNTNFALGGEFWGRSRECLQIDICNLNKLNNTQFDYNLNDWVVIGRQLGDVTYAPDTIPCHWCEPLARINSSKPRQGYINEYPDQVKTGLDSANRIPADYNEALDIAGAAAQRIFTGKVLAELGYTWSEHKHIPHIGIFGGVELAATSSKFPQLWSAGLVGTVQF